MADTEENKTSTASTVTPETKIYTIGGIRIKFPCQPYPSQIAIMDKIIRGLKRTQNCLLESPTGSGKTLALLCGVLAWQKNEREIRENELRELQEANVKAASEILQKGETSHRTRKKPWTSCGNIVSDTSGSKTPEDGLDFTEEQLEDIDGDIVLGSVGQKRKANIAYKFKTEKKQSIFGKMGSSTSSDYRDLESLNENETFDKTSDSSDLNNTSETKTNGHSDVLNENKSDINLTDNPELNKYIGIARVPKIFFGTRTHKQIAQIVKELSRTEYKSVRMCILSSREHTCINSSNTTLNKNELCHMLLDPHNGPGCLFNSNVNRMGSHSALAKLGFPETHDIEDLVKLGNRVKACPYFASRSLMLTADIVFCPYNYLIDPSVRETLNINLNGAVVVFDEAHNVEDISRSAAGGVFSHAAICEAIKDCISLVKIEYIPEKHQFLADFLTRLADWIDQASYSQETDRLWTGMELVAAFEVGDIGVLPFQTFKESFNVVLSDLKEKDLDSNKQSKMTINAATKRLIEELILVLNYLYKDNFKEAYHGQLSRDLTKSVKKFRTPKGPWLTASNTESELKWNYILKIWCLDPSIVFKELKMTRSIILSSGTLSPMDTFESELGVQFVHKFEANHVIDPSQVFVSTVYRGPTNINLNGKYSNAMTFGFQEELGRLIIEVCKAVPHGVLCFLPSYTLMEKLIERWSLVGIMNEIKKHKFVFFEPRNNNLMTDMMTDFYDKINATKDGLETEDNHCITGCLLIGICRGKISEGIDFTDNDARAVITVGIPFPNITDKQIIKKKEYNSKHAESKGLLAGDKWYHIQAFRALNQALGRCIRHRKDWGAIILVDERFCSQSNTQGLSKWVRQQVQSYISWNSFNVALNSFIKTRKELEALTLNVS